MPNVQQLIDAHNGVKFGITGHAAGQNDFAQCTAIPHAWEQMCGLGLTYGNAVDMYGNASDADYIKIPNAATNYPVAGDTVIWHQDPRVGTNQFGHVAVVISANPTTLTVFEQNDTAGGGNGAPRVYTFRNYAGVTGWLHPRKFDVAPAPAAPAPAPDPVPAPVVPDPVPAPVVPDPVPASAEPTAANYTVEYANGGVYLATDSLNDAYQAYVAASTAEPAAQVFIKTTDGTDITADTVAALAPKPAPAPGEAVPVPVKVVPKTGFQFRLPQIDSATFKGIITWLQVNVPIALVTLTDPSVIHAINQYVPWLLPVVTLGSGVCAFIIGVLRDDVPNY